MINPKTPSNLTTPSNLLKKILKKNFLSIIPQIIQTDDANELWDLLLRNNIEKKYNLIITIKTIYNKLDIDTPYNNIENLLYSKMNKTEIILTICITISKLFEKMFNEMIKKETDIFEKKNIWICINLDTLYWTNLNHINFNLFNLKNIELETKKITTTIIISTLDRVNGVFFYTKLKNNNYPEELIKNINFTKGYLICIKPELAEKLKNYKYIRKLINKYKQNISIKKPISEMSILDAYKNESYTQPIWLKENEIINLDIEKYKINIDLNKKVNIKGLMSVINSINFLNSIELSIENTVWDKIVMVINKNFNIINKTVTKNRLQNIIYIINTDKNISILEDNHITCYLHRACEQHVN